MPMAFSIGLGVSGLLLGLGIIGFVIRAMSDGFGAHGPETVSKKRLGRQTDQPYNHPESLHY